MQTVTETKKVIASAVISELQSSDMYLTLVARLFDLKANLNGVRVTEAFLDEIVENENKYLCHPLYADIRGLLANKAVGHMYNSRTGEFYTTQIGAFYHFEKEVDGDNTHLLGYARVPKRNKALCKVLSDLFTDNALKFSFEVNCGVYTAEDDGTMTIDADDRNYWEGECVVTFPACETAIAKQLVAECLSKGDENMTDEIIVNAESEVIEETTEVIAEEVATEVENTEVVAETETAEVEVAETIVVTQEHVEHETVRMYNCDTGEESVQHVTVETITRAPIEIAEEEREDEEKKECGEENTAESEVVAECNTEDDEDEEDKKECASTDSDWSTIIAEFKSALDELRNEIASLKNNTVVAEETSSEEKETETVIAESITGDTEEEPVMNPFMASISAPKKYSLLEKEEKTTHKYSLLERA